MSDKRFDIFLFKSEKKWEHVDGETCEISFQDFFDKETNSKISVVSICFRNISYNNITNKNYIHLLLYDSNRGEKL